jgi:cbb3-type cytochrome oxidase cytochrome c subunit
LPEAPQKDPVTTPSLAGYYLISAILLVVTFGWSLYDEFYGLRPWKTYEREFVKRYAAFLRRQMPKQDALEKQITASAEYGGLEQKIKDQDEATKAERQKTDEETRLVNQRLAVVTTEYTDARANVQSQIYDIEHASSPGRKKSLQDDLDRFQRERHVLTLPSLETGKIEKVSFSYAQLEDEFKGLQARKAELGARTAELLRSASVLLNQRDAFLQNHRNGLSADQLGGLLIKAESASIEIKQINNPDASIVDRCESCHAGIREPVVLTRKDIGGEKDPMSAAFTSHPDLELLQIHDPEKFGCTPCHNGNGMQVDSVEKAHGEYEHWLWPLYHKRNYEAGCQQCHAADMVVDHAPLLSAGKDLYQWRGCAACHRFQGYDSEPEDLLATEKQIQQLETERAEDLRNIQQAIQQGDQAPDNETARMFYTQADALRVSVSQIDMRMDQLNVHTKYLLMGMKKIGPDLKEVRVKIRPEWIPVWLTNPHAWRPTTRMPRFRLDREDVEAISAFLWQSGIDSTLPHQPPGDPVKGRESFETRGCMACHSVGQGPQAQGGWFAANLTRVGEKDNYPYLVRWIHNPRERTRPYCPYEKRELTEADYKKHNVAFVFDLEHSKCPNDGHELITEQMTVMPNLRLSWAEARDIASYLMTLKQKDPRSYAPAPFLNDPKLKAEGRDKVRFYGCAGCHEIAGLEDEGRIGTELTTEGSKPLEQIDFALFIKQAREEDWYSHKGFFEHKLAKPELFDEGMIKTESEQLRMPDYFEPTSTKVTNGMPALSPEARQQISELSTFLMGSVTSQYPRRYFYLPEDQRRDIQEGWWIVKKYNCMGCHQFKVGQDSVLMGLPRYQTPEWKEQLPPKLLTEGARVNPEWLLKFLSNPAMSEADTDRDGVRPYLKARMPTFYFSPIELRKLVRFFQALSSQPIPYIPPKLQPLTAKELEMARALFTSRGAPCLKCHATGDAAHDRYATAPNFLLAPDRLKPDWTKHWILDPAMISPGTAMPSGLFKKDGTRNVFAGPVPPIFTGYTGDHADLLVRYMFEITPEEQRRLVGISAGAMKAAALPRARGKIASVSLAGGDGNGKSVGKASPD